MTPALIILMIVLALVLTAVTALSWRWLDMVQAVRVARERAGGDERAGQVARLEERVHKLERYVEGN